MKINSKLSKFSESVKICVQYLENTEKGEICFKKFQNYQNASKITRKTSKKYEN